MPLVLDASVGLKLVVNEPGTSEARSLLDRHEERVAPDWMLAEIANAIANKVRYEGLRATDAEARLEAMPFFIERFVETRLLLPEGLRLSILLNHALYDCLYLALALAESCVVVSADKAMYKSAKNAGFGHHIELLIW